MFILSTQTCNVCFLWLPRFWIL